VSRAQQAVRGEASSARQCVYSVWEIERISEDERVGRR